MQEKNIIFAKLHSKRFNFIQNILMLTRNYEMERSRKSAVFDFGAVLAQR